MDLFLGKWLNAVDAKGRVSVPAPIRKVIDARSPDAKALVLSRHDRDQALAGFDRGYLQRKLDLIRLKAEADIAGGRDTSDQFSRLGSAFGSAEEAGVDGSGRIILPAGLRRRSGITDAAMFIGVGETFEIWAPEIALVAQDRPEIRDFAEELIAEREGRL